MSVTSPEIGDRTCWRTDVLRRGIRIRHLLTPKQVRAFVEGEPVRVSYIKGFR